MGDVRWVKPRLICAVSTAAFADCTAALAAVIWAFAVATWAVADCTCAFAARLFCGRVIQILLGDGLLLRERSVTIHVELRPALIRLRHGYLSLRLQQLSAGLLQLPLCLRQLSLRPDPRPPEKGADRFERAVGPSLRKFLLCTPAREDSPIPAP